MRSGFRKTIAARFLAIVGILAVVFSCFVLYRTWWCIDSQMEALLDAQAELALQFDVAIRGYVADSIRPFAQQHLGQHDFVPEVMSSSFVARSIFQKVRQKFPGYLITFSSANPRNPENKATPEELQIIQYFNEHPQA